MDFFKTFIIITSVSLMFIYVATLPVKAESNDEVKRLTSMLSSKDEKKREEAMKKLVEIGSPAIPELIDTLKNDEVYIGRMNAAKVLGLIGNPESLQSLTEALNDEHLQVQQEALISLGCIGRKSATPEIIDFIQDNTSYFKKLGAIVLGQLRDERAIPLLEEFALADDPGVAQTARAALDQIKSSVKRVFIK
jgi:HEAT repeat protein